MFLRCLLLLLLLPWAAAVAMPSAPELEFFEAKIRPLLVEKCYECHAEGKKTRGGLALDSSAALLKGGDTGPGLVPGQPEKSLLVEAVRYQNRDLQMPPKTQLSAAEVQALEAWVKMGAPDPRTATAAASGPRKVDVTAGRKFWSFQPVADPQPPTVNDPAWIRTPVDAFILSRLEQAGLRPALPADKRTLLRRATFDLTGLPPTPEQMAAFLADSSPNAFAQVVERLLATPQYGERWGRHWLDLARYADTNGMDENIVFGHAWRYRDYVVRAFNTDKPYDQFLTEQLAGDLLPAADPATREEGLTATGFLALGARVLAEPDVRKLEMDIIDEQLDTTGKTFLGMTFGCCRCHDHKFDPVSTADYYRLAAIFRSTRSLSTEKLGSLKLWHEQTLATPAELERQKQHQAAVKAETAKLTKFVAEARTTLKAELKAQAAEYLAAAAGLPAEADFAQVSAAATAAKLRPRYLLQCRQYLARQGEHPFFAKWRELGRDAQAIRTHYAPLFADAQATDAQAALNDVAGFLAIPDKDQHALDAGPLAAVEQMRATLRTLEDQTPDPPALMCMAEAPVVKALPIHLRGSYLTLGQEVARGFPEVMQTTLAQPIFPARQSGRLELARWMASTTHPLTARVMVNRLWRWHFGQGLVRSTENFGMIGETPSHPELLDWLARHFMEEGWSVKAMHRVLMLSSSYQMASRAETTAAENLDPENRLLWRANLQRLEAEELWDALLAVSGSLDLTVGGKTIALRNKEYVFNHTSEERGAASTTRRALYLPIVRNHLDDLLELFDYPDPTMPTGSRHATVVAPQALLMMNAPVVRQAAERLAERVSGVEGSTTDRIQYLYEAALSRPATAREITRGLAFLNTQPEEAEGWTVLCQTLLATNEFLYLR